MNLTLHIIRKDLRRFAPFIVAWAVAGLFAAFGSDGPLNLKGPTTWEIVSFFGLILFIALSLSLIAGIIQEDEMTEATVFWRTRPISGGRLLTAKLTLIALLFVVAPLVLAGALMPFYLASFGQLALALICFSLICGAWAACCKDLGRYFLFGLVSIWVAVAVAAWLNRYWFNGNTARLLSSRFLVIEIFGGLIGLSVLLNQYLAHRYVRSIALLVLMVLGWALLGAFWPWKIT
jgi:hypothetical protein